MGKPVFNFQTLFGSVNGKRCAGPTLLGAFGL
jgi:hypothetical protein